MSEYYVYFKLEDNEKIGTITAIGANKVFGLEDKFILIPAEDGERFITGETNINDWLIELNNKTGRYYILKKPKHRAMGYRTAPLIQLMESKTEWKKQNDIAVERINAGFRVHHINTEPVGELIDSESSMVFFVTSPNDSNFCYGTFTVSISELVKSKIVDIKWEENLPDKISIFTNPFFNRYIFVS